MTFLPREQILSLEEMQSIASAFIELGVSKIRLTGGEPLIRKDVLTLVKGLGQQKNLKTLALTTNGSQLPTMAAPLKQAGVNRINISLDSLIPERFARITRTGRLEQVLAGIHAAKDAGFDQIKINSVIMKGRNEDEILPLVQFAIDNELDISFIEEMPLGSITEHDREETFCSSDEVKAVIEQSHTLLSSTDDSGGPSRYFHVNNKNSRIGFISPYSHNFCDTCNRVRLTAEGRLLLCLGNEHSMDLRALVRRYPGESEPLKNAIISAMDLKPESHHFDDPNAEQIVRFMNMTGG